jgi:hypothetical protein
MATRIVSKVINNQVFANCGDVIRSLYEDLNNNSDEKVKQYIKDSIELWKDYEASILKQAGR